MDPHKKSGNSSAESEEFMEDQMQQKYTKNKSRFFKYRDANDKFDTQSSKEISSKEKSGNFSKNSSFSMREDKSGANPQRTSIAEHLQQCQGADDPPPGQEPSMIPPIQKFSGSFVGPETPSGHQKPDKKKSREQSPRDDDSNSNNTLIDQMDCLFSDSDTEKANPTGTNESITNTVQDQQSGPLTSGVSISKSTGGGSIKNKIPQMHAGPSFNEKRPRVNTDLDITSPTDWGGLFGNATTKNHSSRQDHSFSSEKKGRSPRFDDEDIEGMAGHGSGRGGATQENSAQGSGDGGKGPEKVKGDQRSKFFTESFTDKAVADLREPKINVIESADIV
jgi:hypothetical protein